MYYLLQNLKFITIFFNFEYLKNKLAESLCNYVLNVKTKTLPFVYNCPSDLIVDHLNEKLMYSMIVNALLLVFCVLFSFIKTKELRNIRNNFKTLDEMVNEVKKSQKTYSYKRPQQTEEKIDVKRQKVSDLKPLKFNLDLNNKLLETFDLESFIDSKSDIENIELIKRWNNCLENEIKCDNEVNEVNEVNEDNQCKKENSFVDVDLNSEEDYETVN